MTDERRPSSDYRWARQVAALLLIGVVVVILVLDVLVDDYDVSTAVLVPLLLTVAGLLSVDLPRLKP
jgi:peptidoglycan/LPS O-acetylase OafA/YrhL